MVFVTITITLAREDLDEHRTTQCTFHRSQSVVLVGTGGIVDVHLPQLFARLLKLDKPVPARQPERIKPLQAEGDGKSHHRKILRLGGGCSC